MSSLQPQYSERIIDDEHLLDYFKSRKGCCPNLLGKRYSEIMNIIFEKKSIVKKEDEVSDTTSTTLPGTIASIEDVNDNPFDIASKLASHPFDEDNDDFKSCGWVEINDSETSISFDNINLDHANAKTDDFKVYGWVNDNDAELKWERREDVRSLAVEGSDVYNGEADELSISSDVVPLTMTDDDALDEISLTRELMGYVEGFETDDMKTIPFTDEKEKEKKEFEEKFVENQVLSSISQSKTKRQPFKISFQFRKLRQDQPPLLTKRKSRLSRICLSRTLPLERESSCDTTTLLLPNSNCSDREKKEHHSKRTNLAGLPNFIRRNL